MPSDHDVDNMIVRIREGYPVTDKQKEDLVRRILNCNLVDHARTLLNIWTRQQELFTSEQYASMRKMVLDAERTYLSTTFFRR